jgi:hypothetical protein
VWYRYFTVSVRGKFAGRMKIYYKESIVNMCVYIYTHLFIYIYIYTFIYMYIVCVTYLRPLIFKMCICHATSNT